MLAALFAGVDDPRAENARHPLSEILFIALAASICGAQDCSDMALFGRSKELILRRFLDLPHGVPSHDTFSRVFRALDPEALGAVLGRLAEAFGRAARGRRTRVVAIDGKACRRGFESGRSHAPPVMVSAWGADLRMTLAMAPADNGAEGAAALEVVALLDLAGAIVTADALHCHRRMAAAILARGGAYLLALKGNRPELLKHAQAALNAPGLETAESLDTRHGRKEHRTARVAACPELAEIHDFPGLRAVVAIDGARDDGAVERRFFVASRHFSPAEALAVARAHWDIENGLHWVLDVVMREDDSRARKDHAPENLAIVRRIALNALRAIDDPKTSIKGRIKRAGWEDQYLLNALAQMR